MSWFFNKSNEYVDMNTKLLRENNELKNKTIDMEQQIKNLEKIIIEMNLDSNNDLDNMELDVNDNSVEFKLKNSVKNLVDNVLKNDSINSSLIPDYIERKLYENVFTIFINLLKEMAENTNINLLNQNISFKFN